MSKIELEDEIQRKNKRAQHWEMCQQASDLWDKYEQSVNDINKHDDDPFKSSEIYASIILSNHFAARHGREHSHKIADDLRDKTIKDLTDSHKPKAKQIALVAAQILCTLGAGALGIAAVTAPVAGATAKILEHVAAMGKGIGEAGTSGLKHLHDSSKQSEQVLLNHEAEETKRRLSDIDRSHQNAKDQTQKFVDEIKRKQDKEADVKAQIARAMA